jgi:[acyl-carrier-protein] S-malonyltransferase
MSGLAVLCPGQGAQHAAMLELAASSEAGAGVLREAAAVLGDDPVRLARGGGAALFSGAVAQPLICAAELGTWAALRGVLPPPRLFAGYSLGELGAHGCAGALTARDTLALAARRAALMDGASAVPGGLLAVRGLPLARLEALAAAAGAELAIVNGPDHAVAGGRLAALEELERLASAAGATTLQRLPIGVAAHTSLLAAAVEPFAAALAASPLTDPPVQVLAGASGQPVRSRRAAIQALSSQVASRLEWARCLQAAAEMGCSVFIELGPGSALARMAAELVPGASVRSVEDFRSAAGVAAWVQQALQR